MTAGFSTTTHLEVPAYNRSNVAPVIGRTNRAARALRRNRVARLHRSGFAPDQEHGVRELGSIYDFDDPSELESTVFVCTLASGTATLLTVGR